MRLLVEFSHPAQVHKFRHTLKLLQQRGVQVLILSRDKEVMLQLLDHFELPHLCVSRAGRGLLGTALELIRREIKTLAVALRFRPNLMLSAHSVAITHIGWILRVPRLVHEDTEFGHLQQKLYMPFATQIITTTAYFIDWGKRQVRIPSLEPLAYLHPRRFEPAASRLTRYGLSLRSRYAVVRTIAWRAMHDRGLTGISAAEIRQVIDHLVALGYEKIVFSAEVTTYHGSDPKVVHPTPDDLHHLLAFASLCLSESITVANEAAVLGVPVLLINPLRAGHTEELERYGLVTRCDGVSDALRKAEEIAGREDAKASARESRCRLLEDKVDMTDAFVEIISDALGLPRASQ